MRIGVLGAATSWHAHQLVAAGNRFGHEMTLVEFAKLRAELAPGRQPLSFGVTDLTSFDRLIVRAIPPGSLEQVVVRMDALHRLQAAGVGVFNPPRAIETAVDKYLATAKLLDASLPTPRTIVTEDLDEAMVGFEQLGSDIVVKPIFGSEGRGIFRVDNAALAYRTLRLLTKMNCILYLQEFIRHPGWDVRAFVVGERVLAAMRRRSAADFRTNVAQGGHAEAFPLPAAWADLAVRAARAVGAVIAGVDLLPTPTGDPVVLEVNSAPGFAALAQTTTIDIPAAIIDFVAQHSA